ncbi:hypothetical protein GCM10009827_115090 [Dactylosporangium maewongense]|uniref:Aconitase/3-isopropylmalate dehydratase large subunit alpha/beta/alpha domain-containing protein n=1 Tax=Dactylosporangium maewongense TaxID=634393 RepID=A0ABP4P9I6_9ACTN
MEESSPPRCFRRRRHGVTGGVNRIIEYHGDGLANLSAMDRHVIANMGADLGATISVFPADDAVRRFLRTEGREHDFVELIAEPNPSYDVTDRIDLASLEPLIAEPSSPGNVVPVREVAGQDVFQVVIGSSANPGLRDFAIVAEIVKGQQSGARCRRPMTWTPSMIRLDEDGALLDGGGAGPAGRVVAHVQDVVAVPRGVTDVFVLAHGWQNTGKRADAAHVIAALPGLLDVARVSPLALA